MKVDTFLVLHAFEQVSQKKKEFAHCQSVTKLLSLLLPLPKENCLHMSNLKKKHGQTKIGHCFFKALAVL